MDKIIESLKKCIKTGTPILIKPVHAEIILSALGIRK